MLSIPSNLNRTVRFASALALMVPAVTLSLFIWSLLNSQLDTDLKRRLTNSLEIYSLVLENKVRNLEKEVASISIDNTVQITLELSIIPQLNKYVDTRFNSEEFPFLVIYDASDKLVYSRGNGEEMDVFLQQCQSISNQSEANLRFDSKKAFMVHSENIAKSGSQKGRACGGLILNSKKINNEITARTGSIPLIWDKYNASDYGPLMDHGEEFVAENTREFTTTVNNTLHRGASKPFKPSDGMATLGVMISSDNINQGVGVAVPFASSIPVIVAVVMLFIWYYYAMRRDAEAALFRERERAVVTLSTIGDGVITTTRAGIIDYLNPAASKLLGCGEESVVNRHWSDVIHMKNTDTEKAIPSPVDISLTGQEVNSSTNPVVLTTFSEEEVAVQFSSKPLYENHKDIDGAAVIIRNVSYERALQQKLTWRATRDELTGLVNRREFNRRLKLHYEEAKLGESEHVLLYIDLDQFKIVNDSCGHHAGDELLKRVTKLMESCLRATDTLARIGGDEFAVILTNCNEENALTVAEKIRAEVKALQFSFENRVFQVGTSIGAITLTEKSDDLESVLSSVDAACYSAKQGGRNRVHLFNEKDDVSNGHISDMNWVPRIQSCLTENRFALYFQKIDGIDSKHNEPGSQHIEILIRMIAENGDLIPPGGFIPVAERYGIMTDIDRWVVTTVLQHFEKTILPVIGERGLVTINISGKSICDDEFPPFLTELLEQNSQFNKNIGFEITETLAISNLDKARQFINDVKGKGCQFLLDDFGSGMSSFGYLKTLPVDYLKIDGLFVKDIETDQLDLAMIKAMNEVAHTLGLKTVAECTENDAILEKLRSVGVDYAQGYGIHKPEFLLTPSAPSP